MECYLKPLVFGIKFARSNKNVSWISRDVSKMGPAYIKVGQFVAARTDVFPKHVTSALSDLHDNVPPEPFESIATILQKECDLEQFLNIDETPLSCASIGQVHRCVLKDYPDVPMVLKVQKPGVPEQVRSDFEALTNIIECMQWILPRNRMITDLYNIVEQCKRSVYRELDFENERKNIKALRDAFRDTPIMVPRVVGSMSTSRVLILEYLPSDNLEQRDTTELVKTIFMAGLRSGVVHGDMHPGNIGKTDQGRYVMYDSGAVIYMNPQMIKELFSGIISKNVDTVYNQLVENQLVHVTREPEGTAQLRRAIKYIIEYIEHVNVKTLVSKIRDDPLLNTGRLHFCIDPDLFLLSRTMSLLEGTCKSVNPNFSYNDVMVDMLTDTDVWSSYMDIPAILQRGWIDLQQLSAGEETTYAPEPVSNTNARDMIVILLLFLNLIL